MKTRSLDGHCTTFTFAIVDTILSTKSVIQRNVFDMVNIYHETHSIFFNSPKIGYTNVDCAATVLQVKTVLLQSQLNQIEKPGACDSALAIGQGQYLCSEISTSHSVLMSKHPPKKHHLEFPGVRKSWKMVTSTELAPLHVMFHLAICSRDDRHYGIEILAHSKDGSYIYTKVPFLSAEVPRIRESQGARS